MNGILGTLKRVKERKENLNSDHLSYLLAFELITIEKEEVQITDLGDKILKGSMETQ